MVDTRTARTPLLAPPRLGADPKSNEAALQEWNNQLYRVLRYSGLGDPAYQYRVVEIDADAPPDPAFATLYGAQATANLALERIPTLPQTGSFTVSGTDVSAVVPLAMPISGTYRVVASANGFTGSPAATSFNVVSVSKSETAFMVTLQAAPGVGATVSFDYFAGI